MSRRRITVLGSTGSIGVSTLDLMSRTGGSDAYQIDALTAGSNVALLAQQALSWRPELAVIADAALKPELDARLAGSGIATAAGDDAVEAAATAGSDWIMAAIVGAAGLRPAWAAARMGTTLALANKESLVCCGPALIEAARQAGGQVIPVDSEHSAIFQVLEPHNRNVVTRLTLTASGGPFRTLPLAAMASVTPEQAVAHPNWSMGAKISVDSATMANKGLEMIEAAYLFGMEAGRIEVLVHPQSIIHSMVEYADGSTLAQLGPPDMRTPIACALAWPQRIAWPAPRLSLAEIGALTFEAPDETRFPLLRLARQALTVGGAAPAIFNAANETAVRAFLDRKIGFLDIAATVSETLDGFVDANDSGAGDSPLEQALGADKGARRLASEAISRRAQAA
ncbi:MAG: 1-deoxy-D-xylulose-5-phosphate reductoisomerase [Caulobacterales bacterium]|nr:1-deoxy-D-xylulose-5-phosphate reductoisomerase [Caulobacterales bacterium]